MKQARSLMVTQHSGVKTALPPPGLLRSGTLRDHSSMKYAPVYGLPTGLERRRTRLSVSLVCHSYKAWKACKRRVNIRRPRGKVPVSGTPWKIERCIPVKIDCMSPAIIDTQSMIRREAQQSGGSMNEVKLTPPVSGSGRTISPEHLTRQIKNEVVHLIRFKKEADNVVESFMKNMGSISPNPSSNFRIKVSADSIPENRFSIEGSDRESLAVYLLPANAKSKIRYTSKRTTNINSAGSMDREAEMSRQNELLKVPTGPPTPSNKSSVAIKNQTPRESSENDCSPSMKIRRNMVACLSEFPRSNGVALREVTRAELEPKSLWYPPRQNQLVARIRSMKMPGLPKYNPAPFKNPYITPDSPVASPQTSPDKLQFSEIDTTGDGSPFTLELTPWEHLHRRRIAMKANPQTTYQLCPLI